MAVTAAASTARLSFSHHLSTSLFAKPFSLTFSRPAFRPRITTSEFNITFAPSKPKPKPKPNSKPSTTAIIPNESGIDLDSGPLVIPWIVRDEKGNFSLQSHPPARLLHEMANASTIGKKKKPPKMSAPKAVVKTAGPEVKQYSKAARRFYNENYREQPQRLCKVLSAAGVASRRSSEELVFDGQVTVNGAVCNTPQDKRNPGLPKPRLFTVGRLDVATTGLIIVSNDGDFAQKLSHPSYNLTKEYIATIEGAVSKGSLITISEGTVIDGVKCVPDAVELLPKQPNISRHRLRIVVHEGRNHEVRELVKNAGLKMYSLKRVRIGGFRLPSDLGLGKHVELKQSDLKALG